PSNTRWHHGLRSRDEGGEEPVERLDVHRPAALAAFEGVAEAVKFGVCQRVVLRKGPHWESPSIVNSRLRYHSRLAAGFRFDGPSLCAHLALQTSQQPRIPPLRSVVADRDAQRLLLPDQHEQPLAPRDPRIDQVALQQHVVLHGERDNDCRELRSLRLVDTGSTKWQAEKLRKVSVEMHKKSSDM